MKGKLIVIEGACDGIGKSTQYEKLKKHLIADGYEVVSHHFPSYNTEQGRLVENYLKGEYGNINDLSPYFINSLYAVDRGVTWYTELKELYKKDRIILLDRYTSSSLIYQAATIADLTEKKNFLDYVVDFEYNKIGIQKPDMVIFLTAPYGTVTKLRQLRADNDGIKNDLHERDDTFMKKVYDNALFVADYLHWEKVNCSDELKNMRSIDDIHNDIYQLVKKK